MLPWIGFYMLLLMLRPWCTHVDVPVVLLLVAVAILFTFVLVHAWCLSMCDWLVVTRPEATTPTLSTMASVTMTSVDSGASGTSHAVVADPFRALRARSGTKDARLAKVQPMGCCFSSSSSSSHPMLAMLTTCHTPHCAVTLMPGQPHLDCSH